MQNFEKIGRIRRLCGEIAGAAQYCEDNAYKTHFDYDGVIPLLEQAQTLIRESTRCLRPAGLPPDIPWCEKPADSGAEFDPYVYDGTMTYEDYTAASAARLADVRLDESRDWEIS